MLNRAQTWSQFLLGPDSEILLVLVRFCCGDNCSDIYLLFARVFEGLLLELLMVLLGDLPRPFLTGWIHNRSIIILNKCRVLTFIFYEHKHKVPKIKLLEWGPCPSTYVTKLYVGRSPTLLPWKCLESIWTIKLLQPSMQVCVFSFF